MVFVVFGQEFDLTNETFLVPEMIFHPADLGLSYILVSKYTLLGF